jgi:hypothetical protein
MDKEDEELPQGPPMQDARTLVTALTRELAQVGLGDSSGSSSVESSNPNLIDRGPHATTTLPNLIDRGRNTSNSVDTFSSFHRDNDLLYHDDEGGSLPLAGFLSDSNVRMALHRSGALPLQRTLNETLSPHSSPAFDERSHFPSYQERGSYVAADFHPSLGPSGHSHLPFSAPYSFSHPSPRETDVSAASIPEKFEPGRETASVLKITKRPKLRFASPLSQRQCGTIGHAGI